MNYKIFQAYDIRGCYKKDFNNYDAYLIAKIFANFVRKKSKKEKIKIAVDYDLRKSSRQLIDAVISGLKSAEVEVIFDGISTSPFYYFIVNHTKADGGIMVTASHLGDNYNGFKLVLKNVVPVDISEFYKFFRKNILSIDKSQVFLKSKIFKIDFSQSYLKFLGLNKKNYRKIIRSKKIIFDSDGDRVLFKNSKGKIIRSDFIACLLAKEYLKRNRGAKIIIDERSSMILRETIKEYGGKVIFCRAGHNFFKWSMIRNKAIFGAEATGHYYFKDFFFCDSGIFAAIKIENIIKKTAKNLDELTAPFQKYYQSGELNFKVKNKDKIMKKNEMFCKNNKAKINKLDGLTCEFNWIDNQNPAERSEGWWFNLRPSQTENLLRLNVEAKNKKILVVKLKELKAQI